MEWMGTREEKGLSFPSGSGSGNGMVATTFKVGLGMLAGDSDRCCCCCCFGQIVVVEAKGVGWADNLKRMKKAGQHQTDPLRFPSSRRLFIILSRLLSVYSHAYHPPLYLYIRLYLLFYGVSGWSKKGQVR
jgi:hypothetical protein